MVDWQKVKERAGLSIGCIVGVGLIGSLLALAFLPRVTSREDREVFERKVNREEVVDARYWKADSDFFSQVLEGGRERLLLTLQDGSRVRYYASHGRVMYTETLNPLQTNDYETGNKDFFDDCDVCGWDSRNHWKLHNRSFDNANKRQEEAQKTFDFYAKRR